MTIHKLNVEAKFRMPFTRKSGLYVCVEPNAYSNEKLKSWTNEFQEIQKDARIPEDYHCTVMWSKIVPTCTDYDPDMDYIARLDHFEYWDGHDKDGYLVAVLTSPSLHHLHKQWVRRGARHSFEDYTAHVTLLDKFKPSSSLSAKIDKMTKSLRGSPLSFTNEALESIKT